MQYIDKSKNCWYIEQITSYIGIVLINIEYPPCPKTCNTHNMCHYNKNRIVRQSLLQTLIIRIQLIIHIQSKNKSHHTLEYVVHKYHQIFNHITARKIGTTKHYLNKIREHSHDINPNQYSEQSLIHQYRSSVPADIVMPQKDEYSNIHNH